MLKQGKIKVTLKKDPNLQHFNQKFCNYELENKMVRQKYQQTLICSTWLLGYHNTVCHSTVYRAQSSLISNTCVLQNTGRVTRHKQGLCKTPSQNLPSSVPLTQLEQLFSLYSLILQVFAVSFPLPFATLSPIHFNFFPNHSVLFSIPLPTLWVSMVKLTVLGHGSTRSVFVHLLEVEQVCC